MLSESYDHLEKTKDELLSERARLHATCTEITQNLHECKADTVRVMQERLKENFRKYERANWAVRAIIDETAKEILEGK
jgi:tryptophanyl-tRNA synthetase